MERRQLSRIIAIGLTLLFSGAVLAAGPESAAKSAEKYTFTSDWFSANIPIWTKVLDEMKGRPNLRYLEIGVYEGRSFFWVMDNILSDPSSKATAIDTFDIYLGNDPEVTFRHNLRRSGYEAQVTVMKGSSREKLRELPLNSFDLIYVDGDHSSKSVLIDAVSAWDLLKENGLMIFDDYDWPHPIPTEMRPAFALDVFQNLMSEEFQVVLKHYQLIIRKIPTHCDSSYGFVQKVATQLECSRLGPYVYYWKPKKLFDASNGNREIALTEKEIAMVEDTLINRRLGFTLEVERSGEYHELLDRLKLDNVYAGPKAK